MGKEEGEAASSPPPGKLSPKLLFPVSPDTGPISTLDLSVHRQTLSFSMDVVCMEMTVEAMRILSSPMERCRMRKIDQQILREDSLIGCVCKPLGRAHREAGQKRKRSDGDPGGQAAEVEGGPRVQSQEEFKKAAVLNSVAVKQRARRMSLRKYCWVWQEGGA